MAVLNWHRPGSERGVAGGDRQSSTRFRVRLSGARLPLSSTRSAPNALVCATLPIAPPLARRSSSDHGAVQQAPRQAIHWQVAQFGQTQLPRLQRATGSEPRLDRLYLCEEWRAISRPTVRDATIDKLASLRLLPLDLGSPATACRTRPICEERHGASFSQYSDVDRRSAIWKSA